MIFTGQKFQNSKLTLILSVPPADPLFNPIENEFYQFHTQHNEHLVPVPVPVPVPIAVQQQRPMPIRQWFAKFLSKHFKKHLPPHIVQEILPQFAQHIPPEIIQQILPQLAQHIPPQVAHQILPQLAEQILPQIPFQFPPEYPLQLSPEYPLQIPPDFPLDFSSPIYQSYPQAILPYLAPNALNDNAMNETMKKKFKFWPPFSGIRERFRKLFFGNKKGNQNQNQGIDRQQ